MTNSGFWQPGEVQSGRSSARTPVSGTSWRQTTLMPPPVLEMRLRVGLLPSEDHLRWQVEAMDPLTKELLAMHSNPAGRISTRQADLQRAWHVLAEMLNAALDLDPFP